jgi:hypothetical protein
LTSAGATAATALSLGDGYGTVNGGIRDGPIIDSTNAVGYVVQACNGDAVGETYAENAGLFQFKFTSNTLTEVADAALDTAAQQNCTVAGYSMYDPQPDERYYVLGIGNATAANNGELIETNSGTGGVQIKPFSFVNSALQTTPLDKPQVAGPAISSPVTEFFNSQVSTVTVVTATTTVVTVTATNTLAVNDMVTISGVTANTGNGCTAADVTTINSIQTVASATGTGFTFDATIGTATTGAGCTVSGATASGGPDYMFFGTTEPDMWSFLLPSGAESGTDVTTNTTDVTGGTSGIVVDNNSTSGQASSLYFGTLATSTTICGTTAAYCAVKLTQSALQ